MGDKKKDNLIRQIRKEVPKPTRIHKSKKAKIRDKEDRQTIKEYSYEDA